MRLVIFIVAVMLTVPCSPCTDRLYLGIGNGLVISTDGGDTWSRRDPSDSIRTIHAVGDNVYVGTNSGLAISVNGGRTWKIMKLNPPDSTQYSSGFAVGNRVYVATIQDRAGRKDNGAKFLISNDTGKTWSVNVTVGNSLQYAIGSVYVASDRIFVGTVNWGLGISDDDGKTWKFIGKEQGLGSNFVKAITGVGDKVYVGLGDRKCGTIAISEDFGESWGIQNTTRLDQATGVNSIFLADDKVYVTSEGGGVSISNDVWKKWNNTLKSGGLADDRARAVTAAGDNIFVATFEGVSKSSDGGKTWTNVDIGLDSRLSGAGFAHCV